MRTVAISLLLFGLLAVAGCSHEPEIPLDMPTDWQTDSQGRWWHAETDTSAAFRNLDTLFGMGVVSGEMVYDGTRPAVEQGAVTRERMIRAIKQSLIPLYRNRPDVVDSLFEKFVRPKISVSGNDPDAEIESYKREAYRTLSRHFREPRVVTVLGRDVVVTLPDSLREVASGRAVAMQIYIDDEGAPRAIALRRTVHPVLDRIALRATVQMRWQPAYVLRGGKSEPITSWTRFRIRFPE